MKISALRILELNEKYGFIEGLSERESTNPEGSGFDLRVGRVERIIGPSFLGVKDRISAKTELVGDYEIDGEKKIRLSPGESLLVRTIETVYAPDTKVKYDEFFPESYIGIKICARTTLPRGVIALLHGRVNPGYRGQLTFGITNTGKHDFDFELGARMFDIEFEPIIGEIKRTYSGQHQGGRMTSGGRKETQN
jgi:deoxycytidine triphosphate deaminase